MEKSIWKFQLQPDIVRLSRAMNYFKRVPAGIHGVNTCRQIWQINNS